MESAANGSTLMKDKDHQPPLFDPSDLPPACAKTGGHMIKPLPYPLWTKHKATLIARYLYYFVLITKHGTYIDGFSGPQKKNRICLPGDSARMRAENGSEPGMPGLAPR